jgi:hypothetical protein
MHSCLALSIDWHSSISRFQLKRDSFIQLPFFIGFLQIDLSEC